MNSHKVNQARHTFSSYWGQGGREKDNFSAKSFGKKKCYSFSLCYYLIKGIFEIFFAENLLKPVFRFHNFLMKASTFLCLSPKS